ncbi:hypothetical protein NP233_g10730 [Leucocoprinus birnbaumii]|uniref:NACHT domain-containing protein n=1 Tax=Leucocoprinus birnbaumii TaxID=56174 RepID=A0AAD5VHX5_9AGAR|nr:hypothetical protein NP233_g10730 [Leucocoprinus birnbaumii]
MLDHGRHTCDTGLARLVTSWDIIPTSAARNTFRIACGDEEHWVMAVCFSSCFFADFGHETVLESISTMKHGATSSETIPIPSTLAGYGSFQTIAEEGAPLSVSCPCKSFIKFRDSLKDEFVKDVLPVQRQSFRRPTKRNTASTADSEAHSSPLTAFSTPSAALSVDVLGIGKKGRPSPSIRPDKELPPIPSMPPGMVHENIGIDTFGLVPASQGLGFFQNASNFSVNQPVMIEHLGRLEIHQSSDSNVFAAMRNEYVLIGAEYNSSDRDDPPRCYPDTRTRFLDDLQTRIYSGTRVIWLYGPAGAGKSTIMQTLAETIAASLACSTLFFSRLHKRQDCKKIFTTIAYNFACVNVEYRRFLRDRLSSDPGFLAKSLEEQFKRLFILPFLNNRAVSNAKPWVIMIDGLDECNSEPDQCRVLDFIRKSILHYSASTPFVWVISSRMEAHLVGPFSLIESSIQDFWKVEVAIGTQEASKSAETFFRVEFAQIRQHHAGMLPRSWPSEAELVKLAVASWGLYIFSKTLSGYIAEEDPQNRLERIQLLIRQSGNTATSKAARKDGDNPFRLLDILYAMIMSDIPPKYLPTAKSILAFSLIAKAAFYTKDMPSDDSRSENPNVAYLLDVCNILDLSHHYAYRSLRKLYSVLLIPPPEKAHESGVQFRHVSFADFLTDESRSKEYYISLNDELLKIWQGYCRIAKQSMYQPGRITLAWEPANSLISGTDLERRLGRRARLKWLELLTEFFHDNPSCKCRLEYRFLPDISETVTVLRGLSPFIVNIPRNLGTISKLYYWLCKRHAPTQLKMRIVVRQFELGQLTEADLEAMFHGVLMKGWACYAPNNHIDLTGLRASEWDRFKHLAQSSEEDLPWRNDWDSDSKVTWSVLSELLRAKRTPAAQNDIIVTLMQLRQSETFVVIGPCRTYPPFEGRGIPYLVFPFVEPIQTVGA